MDFKNTKFALILINPLFINYKNIFEHNLFTKYKFIIFYWVVINLKIYDILIIILRKNKSFYR